MWPLKILMDTLTKEIEDYLKQDSEKHSSYESHVYKFERDLITPVEFYNSVKELISSNEELLNKFSEQTEKYTKSQESIDGIGKFLLYIRDNFSSDSALVKKITKLVSLYVHDYIPFDYLSYKIDILTKNIGKEEKIVLNQMLNSISENIVISRSLIHHRLAKNPNIRKFLPDNFIFNINLDTYHPLQLLVMIGDLLETDKMLSLLKCLTLYGTGFITAEDASMWINGINPFLSCYFDTNRKFWKNSTFHPRLIYSQCYSDMTPKQLTWVFGDAFIKALSEIPLPYAETPLKAYIREKYEEESNKSEYYSASYYICELKADRYFRAVCDVSKYLEDEHDYLSKEYCKALFGDSSGTILSNSSNSSTCKLALDMSLEHGANAINNLLKLRKDICSKYQKESDDYRFHFKNSVKTTEIIKRMVMSYIEMPIPSEDSIQSAFALIKEYMQLFPKISYDISSFRTLYDMENSRVEEAVVLIFYYINYIAKLMDEWGNKSDFDDIVQKAKTNTLKTHFVGSELAHVDLILNRIARQLNKNDIIISFKEWQFKEELFLYFINIKGGVINFKGIVSPVMTSN